MTGEAHRIQIRVSDDELEAFASVVAGEMSAPEEVDLRLAALDIREGLDPVGIAAVGRALGSEAAMPNEFCVARGEAPVPGRARSIALEEPDGPVPGTLREDGSLDFRERRLVVPLEEGDLVARIHPAEPGKAGRSVYGTPIAPPEIPDVELLLGEGVRVEDDRVVANQSGARSVGPRGELDVVDLYVHEGDVDLTSGHLESHGSFHITRDVSLGLHVRSGRDVSIGGGVDGGSVDAEGSVEIARGVIGRGEGAIRAGGDLRVGHALGADLRSQGVLTVARSVSTSRLHAREVDIEGKVLSDEVAAETRIRVRSAGSPSGGPCRLRAAVPLEPADFDPSLRPAPEGAPSRSRVRGSQARGRGARRGRNGRSDVDRSKDLEKRLAWRTHQRLLENDAVIVVDGEAFAGCRIQIGGARLVLEESVRNRSFRLDPETHSLTWTENQK